MIWDMFGAQSEGGGRKLPSQNLKLCLMRIRGTSLRRLEGQNVDAKVPREKQA